MTPNTGPEFEYSRLKKLGSVICERIIVLGRRLSMPKSSLSEEVSRDFFFGWISGRRKLGSNELPRCCFVGLRCHVARATNHRCRVHPGSATVSDRRGQLRHGSATSIQRRTAPREKTLLVVLKNRHVELDVVRRRLSASTPLLLLYRPCGGLQGRRQIPPARIFSALDSAH